MQMNEAATVHLSANTAVMCCFVSERRQPPSDITDASCTHVNEFPFEVNIF